MRMRHALLKHSSVEPQACKALGSKQHRQASYFLNDSICVCAGPADSLWMELNGVWRAVGQHRPVSTDGRQ